MIVSCKIYVKQFKKLLKKIRIKKHMLTMNFEKIYWNKKQIMIQIMRSENIFSLYIILYTLNVL